MFAKTESGTDYYLHQQSFPIINIESDFPSCVPEKSHIFYWGKTSVFP